MSTRKTELKELPSNKAVILLNETCAYCGEDITSDSDEDHVIAKRFVPKGKLNNQWQLVVRAHKRCNTEKSDLEDDISAIIMQPNAFGIHADDDPVLASEAARKRAKSISRRTGKPVAMSREEFKCEVPFGSATFTFGFTSPPQVACERIYTLARLQLMAFFYFITYNQETRRGGFWQGGFHPLLAVPKSDWGNPILRAFMDTVLRWEPRFIGIGAEGFFKAVIRHHPEAACWSWGLEWNKNYRIVGFFGERGPAQAVVDTFPAITRQSIPQGTHQHIRYRMESELNADKDTLFHLG
jgi:hypothetical protein